MEFLFHVTFLHALPGIQRHGLVPGAGAHFGGGYQAHARGKVFLTEAKGIDYWAARMAQVALDSTDHPEEGWVPFPLAVEASGLVLEVDEPGSRDSRADAFFTREKIPVDRLLYFDQVEGLWAPLSDADPDELLTAALEAAEVEVDEDTGDDIYWMDNEVFLPSAEDLESLEEVELG